MLGPVGAGTFEDLVRVPEKEVESPGGAPEETLDVGVVELEGPEDTDVDPELVGPDLGGPVIGGAGGELAIDGVEVDAPLEALDAELGLTAVALEEVELLRVELMEITGGPEETAVPKVKLEVGRVD